MSQEVIIKALIFIIALLVSSIIVAGHNIDMGLINPLEMTVYVCIIYVAILLTVKDL